MDNNFPQLNLSGNNPIMEKSSIWMINPHLRMLLVVLIFVFLGSGIFLIVLMQIQAQNGQKLYEETQAALPKHQQNTGQSASAKATADTPLLSNDIVGWKTYKNDQYGFEFMHPNNLEVKVVKPSGSDSGNSPLEISFELWRAGSIDFDYGLGIYKGNLNISGEEHKVVFHDNRTFDFFRTPFDYEPSIQLFETIYSTFKFTK